MPDLDSVLPTVIHLAEPLANEGVALTADATLEELGFDSLDRVSLAYGLEEPFPGFKGDDIEWTDRTTLAQIAGDVVRTCKRGQ